MASSGRWWAKRELRRMSAGRARVVAKMSAVIQVMVEGAMCSWRSRSRARRAA